MEDQIGSLEVGKKADLVILSFDNAQVTPVHDPIGGLVYSALGNEPETVIIDGKVTMRDRVITTLDEVHIRQRAQKAAQELSERAGISHLSKPPWRSLGY
jgi:5-methylthioadenosine/S-adenosylhomocysteine deaminase